MLTRVTSDDELHRMQREILFRLTAQQLRRLEEEEAPQGRPTPLVDRSWFPWVVTPIAMGLSQVGQGAASRLLSRLRPPGRMDAAGPCLLAPCVLQDHEAAPVIKRTIEHRNHLMRRSAQEQFGQQHGALRLALPPILAQEDS
jgi:hypothetical protein